MITEKLSSIWARRQPEESQFSPHSSQLYRVHCSGNVLRFKFIAKLITYKLQIAYHSVHTRQKSRVNINMYLASTLPISTALECVHVRIMSSIDFAPFQVGTPWVPNTYLFHIYDNLIEWTHDRYRYS